MNSNFELELELQKLRMIRVRLERLRLRVGVTAGGTGRPGLKSCCFNYLRLRLRLIPMRSRSPAGAYSLRN